MQMASPFIMNLRIDNCCFLSYLDQAETKKLTQDEENQSLESSWTRQERQKDESDHKY